MRTDQQRFRRYLDKSEIHDVLLRYARGTDRRDMDMVRSTYFGDAYDDHGDYKGDVDGLIEWITTRHAAIPQSMHFLGNCLIEFIGDDGALVETYFSRRRVASGDDGAPDKVVHAESLGRYIDRFERRNNEWRVAKRIVVYDAVLTATLLGATHNVDWVWGRRDSADALFQMRSEIANQNEKTPI